MRFQAVRMRLFNRMRIFFVICVLLLLLSGVGVVGALNPLPYSLQWNGTEIGSLGGGLHAPGSVAVDDAGSVYVSDSANHQVQKFTSDGIFVKNWSNPVGNTGDFWYPVGIAVDPTGANVYVSDLESNRILKFTSNGDFVDEWNTSGGDPYGVAVDRSGHVFVAEVYNYEGGLGQVQEFAPSGDLINNWSPGGKKNPLGVAVDSNNNVYISYFNSNQIRKFTSNGTWLATWGRADGVHGSNATEFWAPTDIGVDGDDNVYVADTDNNRIQIFNAAGLPLGSLGNTAPHSGQGSGAFNRPSDVAVDSTGTVFAADTGNNRIQRFGVVRAPTPTISAGFYAIGHIGQAPYPVRFLDQSVGSPTAWHWDFGDGSTSTEQSPTHIYNNTGAYNVALTASNDLASDTAIQYRCIIVNTVPVANFTSNATAGQTPFTVQFTDQSSDASGYQWQFGDGTTSADKNPVHTYSHPGTYSVTLTITSGDYGSVFTEKSGYITVTDPPTVGFSANVTAGLFPLAVQFNESITGSVQYYYWQFGDGATSFDREPIHVYNVAGRYTVSLYAIGSNGTQEKTVEDYINVISPITPTPTTPAPVNTTPVPTTQVPTMTLTPVPTNTTLVPTVTTIVPTVTGSPYNGPHNIPGTLQAEDYDLGGEGVAYHDTTAGNEGGVYRHDDVDIEQLDTDGSPNVGWIRSGEWLGYTVNVSTVGTYSTSTYDARFRVASSHFGSSILVYVDNGTTPVANVSVPNTGDWQIFKTILVSIPLPAGQHRLVLKFPTDNVNINWITFTSRGVE
ncbi:Carbohydrate binding family 6 [Methanosphaerula palustris E1-9c]|uniref:Carbohydrate binding family 6 n=1 Tax=Methanosphaerula palustris (strain ATCC BAA-1556 / DSM 19958 / E1-9c) TaxID=521011 RepID=B8GKW7_METPE|nr:PKD domain-containing protein [Methanosphaerula palustris]ACL17263.1 Carbohydrate binding family 6 [Methanosphaerula palustris E1-9c]